MTGEAVSAPAVVGQSYLERSPVPALRALASSVWIQQVGRDAAPYVHRRVPNGAVELVCRVGSAPRVIGPLTEPLVEVLEPGTTVVGMRFVPGAFPAGRGAARVGAGRTRARRRGAVGPPGRCARRGGRHGGLAPGGARRRTAPCAPSRRRPRAP